MIIKTADDLWRETGVPGGIETFILGEDWRHRDSQVRQIFEERGHQRLELGLGLVTTPERIEGEGKAAGWARDDVEVAVGSCVCECRVIGHVRSDAIPEGISAQSRTH